MLTASIKVTGINENPNRLLTALDLVWRREVRKARQNWHDPRHWKVGDGHEAGTYQRKLKGGNYEEKKS